MYMYVVCSGDRSMAVVLSLEECIHLVDFLPFYQRKTFFGLPVCSAVKHTPSKKSSTLKENNLVSREQTFPFRVDPS